MGGAKFCGWSGVAVEASLFGTVFAAASAAAIAAVVGTGVTFAAASACAVDAIGCVPSPGFMGTPRS